MIDADRGPQVAAHENLYRAITTPSWWKTDFGRPSSAAFSFPKFSVDIASRTTPVATLSRIESATRKQGYGLVQFNCGAARREGFDTRDELDDDFPDNMAHAHAYCDFGTSQRKRQVRRLVELCTTIVKPAFATMN